MKTIFALLLLTSASLFTHNLFAQDTIYWKNGSVLKVSDFRGKAGRSPSGTGSYIGVDYDLTNDATSFKTNVYTYFLPGISWVAEKNNDSLLFHEQVRFDMAELFARKLRKAFSEYSYNNKSVVQDIKKIFYQIRDERTAMNEQYNRETKYGTDWKAQQSWANKIGAELDRLSNFAQ